MLAAIVVPVYICDCLCSKSWKTQGNKFQTFSVSGLFCIKRHPTKYMYKKNLTEKTSLCSKSDVKLACNLPRGRFFWLHDFAWRAKIMAERKTPSLIRDDVNKNFNLHMYLRIALLLQNKLLIWRPLGYCELSVSSFNMLFSLLTAADFLYHQFWEFESWSRQSLPTHHNYVYFQQPSVR